MCCIETMNHAHAARQQVVTVKRETMAATRGQHQTECFVRIAFEIEIPIRVSFGTMPLMQERDAAQSFLSGKISFFTPSFVMIWISTASPV
mmetsp:Transcript_21061/g.63385  ORF Transcript_21061/g.63385 Transcript_21061/m.63385 type:complete len:91 (+) Transcript_21061:299-571(+)